MIPNVKLVFLLFVSLHSFNVRLNSNSVEAVVLKKNDIIYQKRTDGRNFSPVVNEEYKVVFFMIAKDASSEWKRMFVRMTGSPNWCAHWIHKPEVNGLKHLNEYPIDQAQEMMTSPDWTRALFVRNPKDRVLSAFLDKVLKHGKDFKNHECRRYGKQGYSTQYCIDNHRDFGFFLKNITTTVMNVHWQPIYDKIDGKWWPYINFIGHVQDLNEDARRLLKSLTSETDGMSAWDHWGTTGWGGDEHECEQNHTKAFLEKNDARHETDAHEKLRKYYTPELEIFVEEHWKNDFNNPYYEFTPVELYPHNEALKLGIADQTR